MAYSAVPGGAAGLQAQPLVGDIPPAEPLSVATARTAPTIYGAVPGPTDRESFFAAQRRNRRATWRLVAMCGVAAVVTGIPLSLVLTPLLFAVVLIVTRLIDLFVAVPDGVWSAYEHVGLIIKRLFEAVDEESTASISIPEIALGAVVWLLPGILLMLGIWPALRMLFRRSGTEGMLRTLDAREPKVGDFEEQQLVNVVQEMAIAAGIPPPRVMLIDSPIANAAMAGSSPEDAVVIVARPLLDDIDRDETQGILADLVASIANGDLRAVQSMVAVFQTFGFASALVRAPISGPARATVGRTLRYIFSRKRGQEGIDESRLVAEMLANEADDFAEGDDLDGLMEDEQEVVERPGPSLKLLQGFPLLLIGYFVFTLFAEWSSVQTKVGFVALFGAAGALIWYQRVYAYHLARRAITITRAIIILPYYLAAMMPQVLLSLLIMVALQPALALLWRTRRYLADATAVQLTRNPDGLARGFTAMVREGSGIPGGKWATPLFVIGAEGANARMSQEMRRQMRQQIAEATGTDAETLDPDAPMAGREARALLNPDVTKVLAMQKIMEAGRAGKEDDTGGISGVVSMHPSLNRRLKRLRRMGATVGDFDARPAGFEAMASAANRGLAIVLAVLIGIAAVLTVVVMVMLLAISIALSAVLLLLVYGLFAVVVPH
jgi:Zn-dependent protease with chaperone function